MTKINYDGIGSDFDGFEVSKEIKAGLKRYVEQGIPTGSFLESILSNDLHGAMAYVRDDIDRLKTVQSILNWLYWDDNLAWMSKSHDFRGKYRECYGSREAFKEWTTHRGLQGTVLNPNIHFYLLEE